MTPSHSRISGNLRWIPAFAGMTVLLFFLPFSADAKQAGDSMSAAKKQGERILAFNSQVIVHDDGTLSVIETIQVRAEGKDIQRGIYRDFPTVYRTKGGRRVVTGFKIVKVLKDGRGEPYHTDSLYNGTRVYIGRKDVYLKPGIYTYTLSYQTDRQVGFFEDHDEIYWNATGDGWMFPIDQAAALIELPRDAGRQILALKAYTGKKGSTRGDYTVTKNQAGEPTFVCTVPLAFGEGLTVFAAWPKGYVAPPTDGQKMMFFFRDYGGAILGIIGFVFVGFFYCLVWLRFGKDPAKGTLVPRFRPPKDISPAAARYLVRMSYDPQAFTAAVVNMAVKGYLKIRDTSKAFTLERIKKDESLLSPDEAKIAKKFFPKDKNEVEIKPKNNRKISSTVKAFEKSLKADYEIKYFLTNSRYFTAGAILSAAWIALSGIVEFRSGAVTVFVFLSGAIGALGWVVLRCLRYGFRYGKAAWRSQRGREINTVYAVLLLTSAALLGWLEFGAFWILSQTATGALMATCTGIAALNIFFYEWLKAPTRAGRKILDEIDGFKMYLSAAEKDRLRALNPPEKTPELFEKYLPYAIALDVEDAWAAQFTEVLEHASVEPGSYSPRWYGNTMTFSSASFASAFSSSFSSVVSSSSTPPGSSSGGGGGGGGFSGGGGGGGGGGGW